MLIRVDSWDRAEQADCVGHSRMSKHLSHWSVLDGASRVHHHHVVSTSGDHSHVVSDHDHGRTRLLLGRFHEIEDLRLNRDV